MLLCGVDEDQDGARVERHHQQDEKERHDDRRASHAPRQREDAGAEAAGDEVDRHPTHRDAPVVGRGEGRSIRLRVLRGGGDERRRGRLSAIV